MPISSFMGLQTALRGLTAHQQALNTTGHNIANANVVGYSRQEAVLTAMPALVVPVNSHITGAGAQLGTGVDVTAIRRIRDQFLDLQFRTEQMKLGDAAARTNSLEQAELAFGEPGENGINALLERFWDAWSALSQDPSSASARTTVIESATTLAGAFHAVGAQLRTVAAQALDEYARVMGDDGDVHVWARELAQLNGAIAHAVTVGQAPNDLLDRRDVLIDRLANLAQVSVTEVGDGSVIVEFGGRTLVDPAAPDGYHWPVTLTRPGGKLGALLELGAPTGPALTLLSRLDAVAADLVTAVNAIHGTGPDGLPFFDPAGTTAETLAVAITADRLNPGTTPDPERNDIAIAIAQLRGGAINRSYGALVAEVGSVVRSARSAEAIQQALVDAIDDRRQSVQGVSPDEEMVNLVRFQRGYEASARVMTTLDSMLDTLINRTGRVGL